MSTTEIDSLGLMEKIHLVKELWDMIADEAWRGHRFFDNFGD